MLDELREEIEKNLPGWSIVSEANPVALRGPLRLIENGNVVDEFEIRIELSPDHPVSPPRVFEVGGRIPRIAARHINGDNSACLFVKDETSKYWNKNSTVSSFIEGPVKAYFLGQSYYEMTGEWIFGERRHEYLGVIDFYEEQLGIKDDPFLLEKLLSLAASDVIKGHWLCPCSSGEILRRCHGPKIYKLRDDVSSDRLKEISAFLTRSKAQALKT